MLSRLFSKKTNTLQNIFRRNYNRKVLISYITSPFEKNNVPLIHNNIIESKMIAEAFDEEGYIVDIVDYNKVTQNNINEYEILFGFGESIELTFKDNSWKGVRVCYCTGSDSRFSNEVSLKKLKEIHQKFNFIPKNGFRFINTLYPFQIFSPEILLILGNEITLDTYKNKTIRKGLLINAPFIDLKIEENKKKWENKTNNSFIYFSGSGSFHKGLDNIINVFEKNPQFTIHLVGPYEYEYDFLQLFTHKINKSANIISHGFLGIESTELKQLFLSCKYLVSDSLSEGQSTSVLNACLNGDLIPVINKRNGISISKEEGILIDDFENLENALHHVVSLPNETQKKISETFKNKLKSHHSTEQFKQSIKNVIRKS